MPRGNPYSKEDIERLSKLTSKLCNSCWEQKSVDQFGVDSRKISGLRSYCKSCACKMASKSQFESKYGVSKEIYYKLVELQNNECLICGREPSGGRWSSNLLSVDHNHATGKIRGLLCINCNTMLGHAKDNPEILVRAAEYLKHFDGVGSESVETRRTLKIVS